MGHRLFGLITMGDDNEGRDSAMNGSSLERIFLLYILTHSTMKIPLLINLINVVNYFVYICLSPV